MLKFPVNFQQIIATIGKETSVLPSNAASKENLF